MRVSLLIVSLLTGCFGELSGGAQQAAPPTNPNGAQAAPVVKPPPVPTGVIPLPQGAPPTGQQAPVPTPVQPLSTAEKPLRASPNLNAIASFLQTRPITIDEAVALSLYANRSFATAQAALLRARARTGQFRSELNPTVGVNANITEFDDATKADFGALLGNAGGSGQGTGTGSSAPSSAVIIPQFNPVITASFTLPLDIFGSLRAAVSQAQFNEVAARIDLNRVRNQLVYDVKNAFYNVLRSQAQVAVATDSVNNALRRLEDANKNYAAGTAPRFDVITAQRDVSDAQRTLIEAVNAVKINFLTLKNTIGIDIQTRMRIVDTGAVEQPSGVAPPTIPPLDINGLPVGAAAAQPNAGPLTPSTPKQPTVAPPLNLDQAPVRDPNGKIIPLTLPRTDEADDIVDLGPEFDAVLREALQTRPEVLEGDAQIAAAQKGVQYARRSSLPSFSLGLSYTYTPNAAGFTRLQQAAATLGVTVPIFDGGLARERVREARADIATAETNRRTNVDQVSVDVQQAYINLVQARNRVAVANVALSQAREAFRLARVRYNAGVSQQTGVSPQLELSTSQNSLTQAETNQINALYDYNTSRAQLDRAAGRYSYVAGQPGYGATPSASVVGRDRRQPAATPQTPR